MAIHQTFYKYASHVSHTIRQIAAAIDWKSKAMSTIANDKRYSPTLRRHRIQMETTRLNEFSERFDAIAIIQLYFAVLFIQYSSLLFETMASNSQQIAF